MKHYNKLLLTILKNLKRIKVVLFQIIQIKKAKELNFVELELFQRFDNHLKIVLTITA